MQTIYLHANAVYRQLLTEFHFHFRAVSESPRETRFLHVYDAIKQFFVHESYCIQSKFKVARPMKSLPHNALYS